MYLDALAERYAFHRGGKLFEVWLAVINKRLETEMQFYALDFVLSAISEQVWRTLNSGALWLRELMLLQSQKTRHLESQEDDFLEVEQYP